MKFGRTAAMRWTVVKALPSAEIAAIVVDSAGHFCDSNFVHLNQLIAAVTWQKFLVVVLTFEGWRGSLGLNLSAREVFT